MAYLSTPRAANVVSSWLIGILVFAVIAVAQSVKVEGPIKSRNGDTMTLQTSTSPNVVVLLNDDTKVEQVQGMLKVRRKDMSMAALIPGLIVKVEGTYDKEELVASSVTFKGNDLERAKSIQAGLHETQAKAEQNKANLEKQNVALDQQQQQIAANKAAIDAAAARFGQLDDYYIRDEVTIYFDNGKTKVDPKYDSQLMELAEKAKHIDGYMIEVKGYASSQGSVALNQQLSEDRANEVANILIQRGHVSLTRMLAPGAMGETHQIGDEKTEQGQAENRRVVVRVLQNKAIAGV
jgi:outer membrane protein OmpA-like peptidoglycan-associated protein